MKTKISPFDEARALCNEFVSDHPGCQLKELQEYVMIQTGLKLDTVRKARKQSSVSLIRDGKNWKCYLRDPEADVMHRGWMRIGGMLPKTEWNKVMRALRAGEVELIVVPMNADVRVDGVKLP